VLPIHVWAVDACALAGEVMFGGGGLVDPPFSSWVLRLRIRRSALSAAMVRSSPIAEG
jgi:hypothetical protein